jgi:hypothetical protein
MVVIVCQHAFFCVLTTVLQVYMKSLSTAARIGERTLKLKQEQKLKRKKNNFLSLDEK